MGEETVSLRLSVEDWQVIIVALTNHADVRGHNASEVAVHVGRTRMRYIVNRIKETLAVKVK